MIKDFYRKNGICNPNLFYYMLGKQNSCYIISEEFILLSLNKAIIFIKHLLLKSRETKRIFLFIGSSGEMAIILKVAADLTVQNSFVNKWVGGLMTNKLKGLMRYSRQSLPKLLIIIDKNKDSFALKEAIRFGIPIIFFTNLEEKVLVSSFIIPGNLDSFCFIYDFFKVLITEIRVLGIRN